MLDGTYTVLKVEKEGVNEKEQLNWAKKLAQYIESLNQKEVSKERKK